MKTTPTKHDLESQELQSLAHHAERDAQRGATPEEYVRITLRDIENAMQEAEEQVKITRKTLSHYAPSIQ